MRALTTIIIFIGLLFTLSVYSQPVMAIDCSDIITGTSEGADPPTLAQIVCPFARVLNIAILAAGAVFVLMLLYGGIKLTLALGDPKGYEGAKNTMTWALLGFLVIIGAVAILFIATRLFGIQFDITNPFALIAEEIQTLVGKLTRPTP